MKKKSFVRTGAAGKAGAALVAWSVVFFTSVCVWFVWQKGMPAYTDGEGIGFLAIVCAVFVPLLGVSYGIMAGLLGGKGFILCVADAALSSVIVTFIGEFEGLSGRLSVGAFVFAAVLSFTALVKSLTSLLIRHKNKNDTAAFSQSRDLYNNK